MRRHFLFAEDENERSVGEGKANLLRLWHTRRHALLHGDASHADVAHELTWLWDLAKPTTACSLSRQQYINFFARCAKALLQPLSVDAAALTVAQRDWSYDLEGGGGQPDAGDDQLELQLEHELMTAEQFRDALLQLAELILPVESPTNVFANFFRELRVCVAEPEPTNEAQGAPDAGEQDKTAARWRLRPLNRVPKIGVPAFLQQTPPSSDALRSIRGLSPPDSRVMSLKQLLLAYNPRKFALARAFSSQVRASAAAVVEGGNPVTPAAPAVDADELAAQQLHTELLAAIGAGANPVRGQQLHRESEWHWDPERARVAALTDFPALRVAVVGPPGSGKTRLAKILARRLQLQYLSLDGVLQSAVERVLKLRRVRAAASQDDEAPTNDQEAADPELDAALSDADVDTLLRGGVLPRAKALVVLELLASRALRAGSGVLLDDVMPSELSTDADVRLNYVVALTALPGDLEPLLSVSEIAPTSRRMYSARELAALQATNPEALEALATSGFADALLPERTLEDVEVDATETSGGKPVEMPIAADEPEMDDRGQNDEEQEDTAESEADDEQDASAAALPPPEPTPAERNEIEPPGESTLPYGPLALHRFSLRFREYVTRMRRQLAASSAVSYQLVVVQACQPLSAIRDHCIQSITGDVRGLSRFSVSHQACFVPLPDNLSDASRADQLRWLLYGDWSELLQTEDDAAATVGLSTSFSRLPRRDSQRRLLSRWQEFCPVASSNANELVQGDPTCAAIFSGRVYLLASPEARRVFCAEPLVFVSREPPVTKRRRLWLVAPGAVGNSGLIPSHVAALEAGLKVPTVRASEKLMDAAPMALQMRLMGGQTVSAVEAAAVVAEALVKQQLTQQEANGGSDGWLLLDLPLIPEVAAVLVQQDCVPDTIVLLDTEAATELQDDEDGDESVDSNALMLLRRQQFQAEKTSAESVAAALGENTRVLSCPLFRLPSDTLAALERALNPLAPRVDRVESGHVPELVDVYDPSAIFTAELSDDEDQQDTAVVDENEDADGDDETAEKEANDDDPEAVAAAKAARRRARRLQGESGRFCPVAWRSRGTLVPGQPSNVLVVRQQFYAFAGERERRAFERDPAAYLPWGPRATAKLVPCVLLLGVRGSGHDQLAKALSKASTAISASPDAVECLEIDMAVVRATAERLQLLDELQREDERAQPEELFATALQAELARVTGGWREQHQLQFYQASSTAKATPTTTTTAPETIKRGAALVVAGLGPDPSSIPSPAALEACFSRDLFPAVVLPLHVSENRAVDAMLAEWETNRPAPRRKLALVRKKAPRGDGESDAVGEQQPTEEEEEEEEEEIEPPEDLEALREEQRELLREQFAEDQTALAEALETLRARGVRVCAPVPVGGAVRQTLRRARRALDGFLARREALFEHCEALEGANESLRLQLASGELHVGKHGTACPVTGRTDALSLELTVVHRDQLYFPRSREARRAFMACPALFLDRDSLPPRHPATCCVAGAPSAGKTHVAQQLAQQLGAVYVSPRVAVDWVVQCQGGSTLRRRLLELGHGAEDALSDPEVTHEAICTRLRSSECQTRGWVLDGYLLTHQQLQLSLPSLTATSDAKTFLSLQPDLLFVLERGFDHVWSKFKTHKLTADAKLTSDMATARRELRDNFMQWQQHRLELLGSWTRVFGDFHVLQLDSERHSLWRVAAQARARLMEQQQLAAVHASAQASGRAARILGVVRTHTELLARQHSVFQTFCPVELRAGRFFTSRVSTRERCVDIGDTSFWLRNERDVARFLASPEAFLGYDDVSNSLRLGQRDQEELATRADVEEEARALVNRAPVSASLLSLLTVSDCDFPELKGYCPVTFACGDGAKDWSALRRGSLFLRASYRSKAYFFVSEAARRAFCTEPTRFAALTLPVKLPPQVPLAKSYPGQLEQQLGAALNDALLALGSERPKFPHVSSRASAIVFLALSLRALRWRYRSSATSGSDDRDEEDETPDEDQQRRQLAREQRAEAEATAKRDAFARDCQLGEQLKVALTPTRAPCGSGAKGARGVRETHGSDENQHEQESRPGTGDDTPKTGEDAVELLCRRFDVIVAGDDADQKPLSADVSKARAHAKAAFLAYTATPSTSASADAT